MGQDTPHVNARNASSSSGVTVNYFPEGMVCVSAQDWAFMQAVVLERNAMWVTRNKVMQFVDSVDQTNEQDAASNLARIIEILKEFTNYNGSPPRSS